ALGVLLDWDLGAARLARRRPAPAGGSGTPCREVGATGAGLVLVHDHQGSDQLPLCIQEVVPRLIGKAVAQHLAEALAHVQRELDHPSGLRVTAIHFLTKGGRPTCRPCSAKPARALPPWPSANSTIPAASEYRRLPSSER